ncbi:MAG TPA: tripartite tricarboxylate transporter substrate-binding protein, partial [Hyphomicrobiaceae bacterium]|nr:tripartite tricarboxylate transporter substrate-binding protein [Hyphomicrobiaceae bacterium]
MQRRQFLGFVLVFLAVVAACADALRAQPWPERSVRLILPYAPGGATDAIGRPWADRLGQALGQPFVIENRGGASGMIGTEAAAKAPPDGYNFLLTPNAPLAVLPSLRK